MDHQAWGARDAPISLRAANLPLVFSKPGFRARMRSTLNLCKLESNLVLAVLNFGMLQNLKLEL